MRIIKGERKQFNREDYVKSYSVLGIIFVLTGLIMLFVPEGFIQAVMVSLGVAAFSNGVYILVKSRHLIDARPFSNVMTVRAVLSMVVGLVAIVLPLALAGTLWLIVSWILAGYLVLSAALQIYGIVKLREAGIPAPLFYYETGVSLVLALILFFMPGTIGITLIRIAGAMVLLGGLGTLGWSLGYFDRFRKTI